MSQAEQLVFVDARKLWVSVLLAVFAAAIVVTGFYGAAAQFGRAVAENYQATAENSRDTARLAVRLAPDDSQAQLISAKAANSFQINNLEKNVKSENGFETAAKLAPHDYRFWLELGRHREQTGDRANGETALRRAIELAPNYAYPRWLLGNLLLRAERQTEAFAEFKLAAENHSALRQQVFYLIWETSGGDAAKIKQMFGDTAQVRAALATFYAKKKLPAESVGVWQSLTHEEKVDNRQAAEAALQLNYDNFDFAAVAVFARDLEREAVEAEKITNGNFETGIGAAKDTLFNWRIEQLKNLDIALDPRQPREGKYSLRLTFKGYAETALQAAQQTVVVEPGARYRLSFAVKTVDLKSAGTPFVEIVEAKTGKVLGATPPFAIGTSDWRGAALEFAAPPDTGAVIIRTARQFCGANCPLVGAVWYDEFKLERLGKLK